MNKCFGRKLFGKLIVLPRSAAKQWTYDKPWACISIADYEEYPKINKVQQIGLIQLCFADIDRKNTSNPDLILFNENHAKQIWDFVKENWNDIEVLMIHCYAGIGRSAAVAAAIEKVIQENDNQWYWNDYRPNALVYSIMLKIAHERGLI